ncbi:M23 family metallopeptidase [Oceanibacterium hippocampi]|uniref:Murein DD-endopeptidase MepM n=1 Tax=Oceanibacterium hippocampi TaxID=745714 RepID=A0A1Y5S5M2_9PROT|nr:M23 family metallopeptidase [Oceanibacterium hippocampi]SLN33076.1 Murein DD-endopeptidase MepM [Oceanibacterium hippocampi]
MRFRDCLLAICLVVAVIAPARAVSVLELDGALTQGGFVLGQTAPGASVTLGGKAVRVAPDGRFVIGFGRDHGPSAELRVALPDGGEEARTLAIAKRDYEIQRIDGLPPSKVTPSEAALERIRRENAEIARVRTLDTPETWFLEGWQWPVEGPISGVFGSQRILNGEPRRPHFGVDVAVPTGTPVVAPAPGRVALAEPDLYFTGGTVMIDHGYGITTVYSHLSAVDVAVGDMLRRGDPIGKVGATGRATGAHLDWRINWFGERLDPELLPGLKPLR